LFAASARADAPQRTVADRRVAVETLEDCIRRPPTGDEGSTVALNLLLIHAAATWALVGLIWIVQLVQYPGFALVGAPQFARFHEHHCARVTWVVGPLMAAELVSAIALFGWTPAGVTTPGLVLGIALILVNWGATAFVSVPLHSRAARHDPLTLRALVVTNWIRTLTWTARGIWVALALRSALGA